jgi:hypothetical protein
VERFKGPQLFDIAQLMSYDGLNLSLTLRVERFGHVSASPLSVRSSNIVCYCGHLNAVEARMLVRIEVAVACALSVNDPVPADV